MSIETMKLALAALETCRIRSVSEWSVEDIAPKNVTAAIEALRTAIKQAEAQQPATGEPGVWPLRAQVWKREITQEWVLEIEGTLGDTDMNIRHTQPLSVAYENVPGLPTIYTHPAPSVPADVVRDAERYRFILAAADDMTTSRYKSLCELLGVAVTGDFDLGAAIDAAMLAAMLAAK